MEKKDEKNNIYFFDYSNRSNDNDCRTYHRQENGIGDTRGVY